ncbi:hypothetical protein [Synechococcus sp. RS9917]|nr:hypothetical protein RS9917_13698 [Synechococcus sp. RS9917]
MTRVSATFLAVGLALCPTAASAAPDGVRAYGRRMEALFVRMDANRDGRLDLHEVRGHPYLERRLLRRDSPGFLRMEHLRGPASAPSGQRLQRRFR